MEPTPAKRPRKRRLWLTALVLVSLISWWNWPRGDARFVGTWRWRNNHIPIPTVIELRSNGSATIHGEQTPPRTIYTFWRVSGEHLYIGTSSDSAYASSLRRLTELVASLNRQELWLGSETSYRIQSVRDAEIRLTREPDGYEMSIVRLPE